MEEYKHHLLSSDSLIVDALEKLNKLGKDGIIFVVDKREKLIGSITDGDVRRGLLKGYNINNPVVEIIQPNPKYIRKGERNINKVIEYRERNYRILPILDKSDKIVNVINFRELKSYLPIDAVIMAGGRGERLRPLTNSTPKPLLRVGDKPILEHHLDRLRLFGIDDFWITVKYLGEKIENFFVNGHEKSINIQYVHENEPLGTIGAVSKIRNFTHDYILVTNSDLLTNIDYEHFFLHFLKEDADLSVVTIPYSIDIPYAVLETNNGQIISYREKPTYTYVSNGGIYLMKREVLKHLPIEKLFDATDLLDTLINNGNKVISYPFSGYWLDIGRYEEFEQAQKDILTINFR